MLASIVNILLQSIQMAESCAWCSAEAGLLFAEIVPRFSKSKFNSGDVPEGNQTLTM